MVKIGVLLPYEEMPNLIRPMLPEYKRMIPMCVEYTKTENTQERAMELERQGCELIIARGLQAMIIRKSVRVPLIEIQITTQELGIVVKELKENLGKERPVIALTGFANMFSDTSCFGELFGVELRKYIVTDQSELTDVAAQAKEDGADALIGGKTICEIAREMNMPHCFLRSGTESLRNALEAANRSAYAIETEKQNSNEISLILNSASSGILRLDKNATVMRANDRALRLLEKQSQGVTGMQIRDVIPKLDPRIIDSVLTKGQEVYTALQDRNQRSLVINAAPILVEGENDGVMLTLDEGTRVLEMDSELRRELYQRGFAARYTFSDLISKSPEIKKTIELAKRIARYNYPVLLTGENGVGKLNMAQCIHNESLLRDNAFVSLDCSAWQPETMDNMLFGNYSTRKDTPSSLCELAENGTLYLSHVDALPLETQYKLLSLIDGKFIHNGSNQPQMASVRVIVSTNMNLISAVEQGNFRSDLYYALNVLSLELPPLRRRREDIPGWVSMYLNECQKKHKKYVNLTQGAQKFLQEYDWPGNLDQVKSVCERIVLLTQKRNVDEVFLKHQLEQIAPKTVHGTDQVIRYRDEKADRLAELLRQYGGNRQKVADELGISKTTLWRYIKKYGIEQDFTY